MAIAKDTTSSAGLWNNTESSVTWSHTCNGTERLLAVWVNSYAGKTTGVTYNGTAMTHIATQTYSGTPQRYVSCYVLINPSSGSNNIVWSLSGTDYCKAAAVSFTGAKQTGQPQAYDSTRLTSANTTKTLTTTEYCLLAMGYDAYTSGLATGTESWVAYDEIGVVGSTSIVSAGNNSLGFSTIDVAYDFPQVILAIESQDAPISFQPRPISVGNPMMY